MQIDPGGGGKSIKRHIVVEGGGVVTRVRGRISKKRPGPWTTFWVARLYKTRLQTNESQIKPGLASDSASKGAQTALQVEGGITRSREGNEMSSEESEIPERNIGLILTHLIIWLA